MKLLILAALATYAYGAALTDSDKRAVGVCLASQVADNTSKIGKFKNLYASKTIMDAEIKAMKATLNTQLSQMKASYDKTKLELDALLAKKADKSMVPGKDAFGSGGSTYIAWGWVKCPTVTGTATVYTGWSGGGYYQHQGSGVQYLCMADVPEWGSYNNGSQNAALLYQTEYETSGYGVNQIKGVHDREMACAVCLTKKRGFMLMVPGRRTCYSGWTTEYRGFLMSSHHGHNHATEWICVYENAQRTTIHNNGNQQGSLIYVTEMECTSHVACNSCPAQRIPQAGGCARYAQNREIACSVCTK